MLVGKKKQEVRDGMESWLSSANQRMDRVSDILSDGYLAESILPYTVEILRRYSKGRHGEKPNTVTSSKQDLRRENIVG